MRDEVESIVKSEGWTKAAMQKMRKVDSFLRECQRYHGLGPGELYPDSYLLTFLTVDHKSP